ncbi:MAG: hypothetical protein DHS20C12_07820 [Pseudohongiella sp.]|nr:MAG: hypothetical protein DHS20C12_07820 [Pseudohongiella sp.]
MQLAAVLIQFVFMSEVAGQDAPVYEEATQQRRLPYEVVVRPNVTRGDLRNLIQGVEDDFFEKFNELNIDENYDIVCYKHTPTMSHISERVCEPLFLIRARGSNASESAFLGGSQGKDAFNQSRGSAFLDTPDIMKRVKKKDFEILQEKIEELNRSNEELRSIGSVLAQLKSRLENFGKDD